MGLFADELFAVLVTHQHDDYSYLQGGAARQDPIWHPLRLVPIEAPVIQRIKQAVRAPDKMAQLNARLLEETVKRLRFTSDEYTRLRAALLAESVSVYLRNRMEPEETSIVDAITASLYQELLGRLRPITERIRGDVLTDSTELALMFCERAAEMADAAEMASRQHQQATAVFWGKLARTAYEQAVPLLMDGAPEFAAVVTQLINNLPA